ncbi:hypothetical protein BTVI_69178 [Pitangus sulphuratus]|nr:hypothetical protein BTVI_69178 [Pitangus sulphuratus]
MGDHRGAETHLQPMEEPMLEEVDAWKEAVTPREAQDGAGSCQRPAACGERVLSPVYYHHASLVMMMRYLVDRGERLPESVSRHLAKAGMSHCTAVPHTLFISSHVAQLSHIGLQKIIRRSPLNACNMYKIDYFLFMHKKSSRNKLEISEKKSVASNIPPYLSWNYRIIQYDPMV